MKRAGLICAFVFCSGVAWAQAADTVTHDTSVVISIGEGAMDASRPAIGDKTDTEDTAYTISLHHRYHRNFGVGVRYADFGRYINSGNSTAGAIATSEEAVVDGFAIGIDAVGLLPLGERFTLFGSVGIAHADLGSSYKRVDSVNGVAVNTINADTPIEEVVPTIGIGGSLQLSERWAIQSSAIRYIDMGDFTIDVITIGAQFSF